MESGISSFQGIFYRVKNEILRRFEGSSMWAQKHGWGNRAAFGAFAFPGATSGPLRPVICLSPPGCGFLGGANFCISRVGGGVLSLRGTPTF